MVGEMHVPKLFDHNQQEKTQQSKNKGGKEREGKDSESAKAAPFSCKSPGLCPGGSAAAAADPELLDTAGKLCVMLLSGAAFRGVVVHLVGADSRDVILQSRNFCSGECLVWYNFWDDLVSCRILAPRKVHMVKVELLVLGPLLSVIIVTCDTITLAHSPCYPEFISMYNVTLKCFYIYCISKKEM